MRLQLGNWTRRSLLTVKAHMDDLAEYNDEHEGTCEGGTINPDLGAIGLRMLSRIDCNYKVQ